MERKKVNNKLFLRRIIVVIVLIIAVTIVLFGIVKLFKSILGKEKVVGNLNNRGLALEIGNETYYNKYEKGIIKVKGSREYELTEETAYSMTYYKNKIYYLTVSSSNTIDLKSIDTNGENLTFIETLITPISKFYIDDGYLYYVTNKDVTGISKLELESGKESILNTANVQDFVLDNKTIYYTDNVGYLYSVNIDGTNNIDVSRKYLINKIQILDKWIYYYDSNSSSETGPSGLYKIKKDGTSRTLVSENVKNEFYNITNKGIYYFNSSDKKIYKTDFKGKKQVEIASLSTQMTRMNIANGIVYYLDKSADETQIYQIFRVKENGKKAKSIDY